MAETAWTSQHGKDFDDFSARLPLQLRMLQRLGVNYRPMDTT
jgi:N-acetyl-beta-hexosaminidase